MVVKMFFMVYNFPFHNQLNPRLYTGNGVNNHSPPNAHNLPPPMLDITHPPSLSTPMYVIKGVLMDKIFAAKSKYV